MLHPLLKRFAEARIAGPFSYAHHHHHDGGAHGTHLVIGSMIHGNEVGSLPAVVRIVEELRSGALSYGGPITLFIGNPEAGAAGVRLLEADLNRVFVPEPPDSHEGRRAAELMPILDTADVFLDLHQTILHTEHPFYIFPWDADGWRWARAMAGATHWVTRAPHQRFSAGTCCADEYVRLRSRPGITLELGQAGFSDEAESRAYNAITSLMRAADAVASGGSTLHEQAERQPDLEFVHTVHRERFVDPSMRLRAGLTNFMTVQAGEVLSAEHTPQMVAPQSGVVLFPKYVQRSHGLAVDPRPGEIYRIVQPLPQHPNELWGE
ncbi:MAG: succinylglutamate desuccinylase [Kiritimatiellia bacterium]